MEGAIKRTCDLVFVEALEPSRRFFVEQDFFDELRIAEVLEAQRDAWRGGVHEPLHIALDLGADGFSGKALRGAYGLWCGL